MQFLKQVGRNFLRRARKSPRSTGVVIVGLICYFAPHCDQGKLMAIILFVLGLVSGDAPHEEPEKNAGTDGDGEEQ